MDPNQAWLGLVFAAETAANRWKVDRQLADEAEVGGQMGDVIKMCRAAAGDDHAAATRAVLGPLAQAGATFRRFLDEFRPQPPLPRPPEAFALDWSKLRKPLDAVYRHRSAAVHTGIPMPPPMCLPPPYWEEAKAWVERPPGLKSYSDGASWKHDDLMLLSAFEHLVRGALLNWWRSLVPPASVAKLPAPPSAGPAGDVLY
jgi:hypothetical protein